MSKLRMKTIPDLAATSPKHQAAIALGDEQYSAWQYNVADQFKEKTVEEIKQHLQDTAFPFAVCMENWNSDFNFSSLARSANAFNAKEIFYIGNKKVDRRGMLGVQNYSTITWLSTIDNLIKLKDKYVFVAVDNVSGSVPLPSYSWKENSLMIFGSEGTGLTQEILSMCEDIVHIPMYGSIRSFNAAAAASITMYDYTSKFKNGIFI